MTGILSHATIRGAELRGTRVRLERKLEGALKRIPFLECHGVVKSVRVTRRRSFFEAAVRVDHVYTGTRESHDLTYELERQGRGRDATYTVSLTGHRVGRIVPLHEGPMLGPML